MGSKGGSSCQEERGPEKPRGRGGGGPRKSRGERGEGKGGEGRGERGGGKRGECRVEGLGKGERT
jgi:hypothetical protein